MNDRAKNQHYTSDNDLKVHCGCQAGDVGSFCDKTFDGTFEGTCQPDGECR